MKPNPMIVPTAAAALLAASCQSSPEAASDSQGSSALTETKTPGGDAIAFPAERTASLFVKGLACPYCVQNIDRQLAGMTGVEQSHTNLQTGEVRVLLAKRFAATRDQLVKAIDESGFTLDRIEMPQ